MNKTLMASMASLLITVSGCTTIHFDNGQQGAATQNTTTEQWHHNLALGLYEYSEPVNLEQACQGGEWSTVKIETSVINGLAQSVASSVLGGFTIWSPKTVSVACQ